MAAASRVTFASDSARLARRPALWSATPVCRPSASSSRTSSGSNVPRWVVRPATLSAPTTSSSTRIGTTTSVAAARLSPVDPRSHGAAQGGRAEGRPRPTAVLPWLPRSDPARWAMADSRAEPGPTRVRVGCRRPAPGPSRISATSAPNLSRVSDSTSISGSDPSGGRDRIVALSYRNSMRASRSRWAANAR